MKRSKRSVRPLIFMGLGLLLILAAVLMWAVQPASAPGTVEDSSAPAAVDGPYPDVPRVSVGDAKAAFELKNAVFVDVRGDVWWEDGHIPGALSIPYDEVESHMGELNPDDWIITYCS